MIQDAFFDANGQPSCLQRSSRRTFLLSSPSAFVVLAMIFYLKTAWLQFSTGARLVGIFLARSNPSMRITFEFGNQSGETNRTKTDYARYTFPELLKARYWNSDGDPAQGKQLEQEIQKRCAHIQTTINRKGSAAGGRFRPYGLIFGVIFLVMSIGPFVAVEFLGTINFIIDIDRDHAHLSGLWALLTLPFAVIVYLIGGMMDAERVVKWFNL